MGWDSKEIKRPWMPVIWELKYCFSLSISAIIRPLQHSAVEMTYWKLNNVPVKATDKQLWLLQAINQIPIPA